LIQNKSINLKPKELSQTASRSSEFRSRPNTAHIKDNNLTSNQNYNNRYNKDKR